MRPRHKSPDEPVGQDSFLDIVSNLVGILIILVMVVGVRAKDAILHADSAARQETPTSDQPAPPVDSPEHISADDVREAREAETAVERDIHRIHEQLRQQEFDLAFRQQERDQAQLLVAAAEQALDEQRSQLTAGQREELDQRSALAAAESELAELQAGITHFEAAPSPIALLEHLPTPMAKTVFGRELHARLHGGRIALVPWDAFIQLLKEDAPKKAWRLKEQEELTELVGPVGGFWMRYILTRQTLVVPTKVGVATQQSVELDRFTLVPENEQMGEPVADALQSGSQFLMELTAHRPETTTVTVWTYPDSYREFRELKRALFERGYVTAARPLPADHPIGGSPSGTRSAAQ
jgi:hypothetical protein